LYPNLSAGFLLINLFTKSTDYLDQVGGISYFFICTCLDKIISRIYFLDFPVYGLLPIIIS